MAAKEQSQITTADLMKLADWQEVKAYSDITYHKAEGIARIAFNRPEVRNAFRPKTIDEITEAVLEAWYDSRVGVVWLTANGPSPRDGIWSFCAGGDQKVRAPRVALDVDDFPVDGVDDGGATHRAVGTHTGCGFGFFDAKILGAGDGWLETQ